MSQKKFLVLDANILVRAVLGTRIVALFEIMLPSVRFFTPEICVTDAYKYLPLVVEKRRIKPESAIAGLDAVMRNVNAIDKEIYEIYETSARKRMRVRDVDDWHVVACSLLLDCPIWTEDKDFFGAGVAVWTTDRVEIYLEQ